MSRSRSTPSRTRRLLAITALGACLFAAGCSQSAASPTDGPTAAPATSAASEVPTPTTAEAPASTTSTTRSTTSSTTGSTTGDPNTITVPTPTVVATPGNEAYCTKIATAMHELNTATLEGLGDGGAPAERTMDRLRALYQELAETAPADIAADVRTIADKLASIHDLGDLDSLGEDPEAAYAGARFGTWIEDNCGFDPNSSGPVEDGEE